MRIHCVLFAVVILIGAAGGQSGAWTISSARVVSQNVASTPNPEIQNTIERPDDWLNRLGVDFHALNDFYSARNYQFVWTSKTADLALSFLKGSASEGLDPKSYHLDILPAGWPSPPSELSADYDVLLTAALLSYLHDLRVGRVSPAFVENDVDLPTIRFDAGSVLSAELTSEFTHIPLDALLPPHAEYSRLRDALARYRGIALAGGWQSVDSFDVQSSKSNSPSWKSLSYRLNLEDNASDGETPSSSIEALHRAILRYQVRNGIPATGKLDRETLASLNVPVQQRIDQISCEPLVSTVPASREPLKIPNCLDWRVF